MDKRALFKFYSSYYDVAQELDDKDRLAFYDALMTRQFTGIEVELKGMAKFAFISQKHSIDKQVEGWEFKMKTTLNNEPIEGGIQGGIKGPCIQEEVKEKEEVKEELFTPTKVEKLDFDLLLKYLNKKTGRNYRVVADKIKTKYTGILKQGYTKEDIKTAIDNAVKASNHIDSNFQYLTMEFFSRSDKLDMYSAKKETLDTKPQKTAITYSGPFHN